MKITFLLRLSPVIPFNLLNYFMGLTGVKLSHYVVANLGMIPGTAAYVFFGTSISSVADAASGSFEGGTLQLVLTIVGAVLAVVAVCYVSWLARREIKKNLDNKPADANSSSPNQVE